MQPLPGPLVEGPICDLAQQVAPRRLLLLAGHLDRFDSAEGTRLYSPCVVPAQVVDADVLQAHLHWHWHNHLKRNGLPSVARATL
jgi:hypothetical protein